MTVWFATGNIHKKEELSAILNSARRGTGAGALRLRIPSEAGLAFDPEETGSGFFENALIKAEALRRLLEEKRPPFYAPGDPVIADDSGLCVDALGGRPGIYSARYGGPPGSGGAALSQEEKNARLLSELDGNPRRTARFVCAMVLLAGESRFFAAQETMEGELVEGAAGAKGKGGFGYDPILYIPFLGRTVAELSEDEKNLHSHRGKAGRAIARFLAGGGGIDAGGRGIDAGGGSSGGEG